MVLGSGRTGRRSSRDATWRRSPVATSSSPRPRPRPRGGWGLLGQGGTGGSAGAFGGREVRLADATPPRRARPPLVIHRARPPVRGAGRRRLPAPQHGRAPRLGVTRTSSGFIAGAEGVPRRVQWTQHGRRVPPRLGAHAGPRGQAAAARRRLLPTPAGSPVPLPLALRQIAISGRWRGDATAQFNPLGPLPSRVWPALRSDSGAAAGVDRTADDRRLRTDSSAWTARNMRRPLGAGSPPRSGQAVPRGTRSEQGALGGDAVSAGSRSGTGRSAQ